jgi:hypothetical protein
MADRFVVGDTVTLSNTFAVSGTATDPTTVSLVVTDPAGTATTYTYAGATITKSSTGVYTKNITASTAGVWLYTWTGTGTAADVQDGSFTVRAVAARPLTNYATRDELKSYVGQGGTITLAAGDDAEMDAAITSASRQIDAHCNRRFYLDASVSVRVFAAESATLLKVDDFSTTTGLIVKTDTVGNGTFDRTWTTADYQLEPLNGVNEGLEGWPFWRIRAIDDESFPVDPTGRARVQVTAKWGWAAVPDAVFQACLVQSPRELQAQRRPRSGSSASTSTAASAPAPTSRRPHSRCWRRTVEATSSGLSDGVRPGGRCAQGSQPAWRPSPGCTSTGRCRTTSSPLRRSWRRLRRSSTTTPRSPRASRWRTGG